MRIRFLLATPLLAMLLSGCVAAVVGGAAAGARAAHDRRDFGTYVDDKRTFLTAYDSINGDRELALRNNVKVVVYDGVILLIGEVRDEGLKQRAQERVSGIPGTRRIVNDLLVGEPVGFWARRRDNTISAHIKTALLDLTSLPGFDPTRVNVTTAHRTAYLMGKVTREEEAAVVEVARNVRGVERVVKAFDYID